jgi:Domain amino terminal to FKBP-type peptidyl-prolyl isomerase/FKBP-type peptidyl-prolyl cis-trans isomerase
MLSLSSLLFVALLLAAVLQVVVVVVRAEGTDEAGLAFLKANKEKEGVIELPSGLQYKILKSGSGAYHPGVSTSCSCHYAGRLIDGTEFDSSYGRGEPSDFAPNQVIKGWTVRYTVFIVMSCYLNVFLATAAETQLTFSYISH